MANEKYAFGAEAILEAYILSVTVKAALVHGASYTPNLAVDEFLSDIPGGAIIATSAALTSKSATGGAFSADNPVFAAVSGGEADYIVIYADSGSPSTSRLIALLDTATNLPFTPAGGSVTIAWDTGTNKIFHI